MHVPLQSIELTLADAFNNTVQVACRWECCHPIYIAADWSSICAAFYKAGQEAQLSWLWEFDTVFYDYYLSSGLEDEVVMGRQEVDLHRLQNESGLTQLYWPTPCSSQFSSPAPSRPPSLSLCISLCLNFFLRPPYEPALPPTPLQLYA